MFIYCDLLSPHLSLGFVSGRCFSVYMTQLICFQFFWLLLLKSAAVLKKQQMLCVSFVHSCCITTHNPPHFVESIKVRFCHFCSGYNCLVAFCCKLCDPKLHVTPYILCVCRSAIKLKPLSRVQDFGLISKRLGFNLKDFWHKLNLVWKRGPIPRPGDQKDLSPLTR